MNYDYIDTRLLMNNIPYLISIMIPDGSVLLCSAKLIDYLGSKPIKLSPEELRDLIHPEERTAYYHRWKAAFSNGEAFEGECRIINAAKGGYQWFLVRVVPIRNGTDDIEKWIMSWTAIEQQKPAEKSCRILLEATRQLNSSLNYQITLKNLARQTVPAMADICMINFLEGGETKRIIYTRPNTHAATYFRQIEDAVFDIRQLASFSTAEVNRTIWKNNIDYELIDANIYERPIILIGKNLNICACLTTPICSSGRPIGTLTLASIGKTRSYSSADAVMAEQLALLAAVSIENDISYRKLKRSVRVRDDLVATVSHDLKTPLCAIRLNIDVIARSLERNKPEDLGDYLKRAIRNIRCSTDRVLSLIKDLLDIAMIESGEFRIQKRPTDLRHVIDDVLTILKPMAEERQIEISTIMAREISCLCDKDKVFQLFSNLIGNAIKFVHSSGKIWIRAEKDTRQIKVSIGDNGPGINKADLDYIFDRFYRGKTCGHTGSGLGLAISKAIVNAHNGHIWVESDEGKGTTFSFALPMD